jgi:hypothetical protein
MPSQAQQQTQGLAAAAFETFGVAEALLRDCPLLEQPIAS